MTKGDVVFDTTRQNNHRTPDHGKEEKGGITALHFGRHLRTLNPYLLLLVLKTTGLNGSDERKSFIVTKTVNLHK